MPVRLRRALEQRAIRPAAARWLRPRTMGLRRTRMQACAERESGHIQLTLDDGTHGRLPGPDNRAQHWKARPSGVGVDRRIVAGGNRLVAGCAVAHPRTWYRRECIGYGCDLPTAATEIWWARLSLSNYLRSLCGPLEPPVFARDDLMPALREAPSRVTKLRRRKRAKARRT